MISVIAVALAACDLDEGPREETREAVEAAREGRSPEAVQRQAEDVGAREDVRPGDLQPGVQDRTAFERDLERDLRKAEEWVAEVRRDIAAGARKTDAAFDRSLEQLDRDVREAREDYDRLARSPDEERRTAGEQLRDMLRQLSLRIDALDGEIDDQPGRKDPLGPG